MNSSSTPSAGVSPFTASTEDKLYIWGGEGDTEPEAVFIYSVNTETWMKQLTTGPHPPAGLHNGGCSAAGQHLYLYGGYVGTSYSGSLYQLNTDTWTWTELCNHIAGGPLKKRECRMITYQDQLWVVGGYYGFDMIPDAKQRGAKYEEGYTNEIHCYSLNTETWSSPHVSGSRPPPCSGHSLTMIDEEKAVMFGGSTFDKKMSVEGCISDLYILHLPTVTWRKESHKQNKLWPKGRCRLISVCLGYGGQSKSLLISGGHHGANKPTPSFNDIWVLDLETEHWEEVHVGNRNIVQRNSHCAAAFPINAECSEVTLFGGRSKQDAADTAILLFEYQKFTKKWCLTDMIDYTQLGSPNRLSKKRGMMETLDMQTGNNQEQMGRLHEQLPNCQLKNQQVEELQRRLIQLDTKAKESDRRAQELDRNSQEADKRAQESDRKAQEAERRAEEAEKRAGDADRRAEELRKRTQDLERFLADMRQVLKEKEDQLLAYDAQWVVRKEDIELTGPELGRGAWATVTVAKFRGAQVAVKRIHNLLISRHNSQLFRREMNMASRLRHPNLVQFIGATVEGDMMIVMEFMTTSLRAQLQKNEYFSPSTTKLIGLDVALALNYLHQIQPDPLVHRDISSANVLLEIISQEQWKAKVTDYGTVNFVRQLNTDSPGGPAYAAPEASNAHLQSPKMDIYSFGALVLEMLTGRIPAPDHRVELLCKVHHEQLLGLIRRCLSENTADRPTASDIISILS